MLTRLTPKQEAALPEYARKWTAIGLSTDRIDREKHDKAVADVYALADLKPPRMVYTPCPLSGALAAAIYKHLAGSRSSRGSAVYSAVDSAVRSAVHSAVDSAVDSSVRSAVYSAVNSAVRSAVGSAVRSAVGSSVGSSVDSAVHSSVDSAVRSSVDSSVDSAVDSAVRSAVYSAVDSAVRSAVYSSVDSAVDSAVHSSVRSAVHSSVNSAVHSSVNSAVRSSVRSAVHSSVNSAVRSAVDSAVHSSVNSAVDSPHLPWAYWLYGNQWAGYGAWGEFFKNECAISVNAACIEMMRHGHYIWPFDRVCFASEKPIAIHTDDRGLSHREDGPAVEYESGWGPHCWHGVVIPPEWITKPPSAADALRWENMEQRRAACEMVGWTSILEELDARSIDKHENPMAGELVEVEIPDVGRERFLRVQCGTNRLFALPVPPEMQTVEQSQRWLNFIPDDVPFLPELRT